MIGSMQLAKSRVSWTRERKQERERRDSGVATGLAREISGKAGVVASILLVKCHLASNWAWGRVRPRFSRLQAISAV